MSDTVECQCCGEPLRRHCAVMSCPWAVCWSCGSTHGTAGRHFHEDNDQDADCRAGA